MCVPDTVGVNAAAYLQLLGNIVVDEAVRIC